MKTVTYIINFDKANSLFANNDNLESLIFESEDITELSVSFLTGDKNLKNVQLPKNLKTLPDNLFKDCTSLETIEIPNEVTELGDFVFENSGIYELKLPESVTTVGELVFQGTTIEKLYLPESLKTINNTFLSYRKYGEDNLDYMLTVYVKKDSYTDQHYEDYCNSSTAEKAYY